MLLYRLKKSDYIKIFIILVVSLILLQQIDFFRKFYFLYNRSYETRLINNYEFCGHESIGFLAHIKKKYNIDYKIPIINYGNSPNSSWYYSDLKNIKTDKIIFLNYRLDNEDFDYKLNNNFSYYLKDYKILDQVHNCYFLTKK